MKSLWVILVSPSIMTPVFAQAPAVDAVSQVVQTVLDCPKFEVFLHPEVEGRIPLLVAGSVVPDGLRVVKYGKNIVKVVLREPETRAVIVFDELLVVGNDAKVRILYPAEGVSASFTLRNSSDAWSITSSQVIEQ